MFENKNDQPAYMLIYFYSKQVGGNMTSSGNEFKDVCWFIHQSNFRSMRYDKLVQIKKVKV